jgi:hypothetical protein
MWHLLHHVLPLEELATSGLKHKINYTQSRTQHAVKVLLCGWSVPVGEDMAIQALHPPYVWDSHCSIV